ncbi:MAG TPA: hypothetical protein VKR21_16825 [Solirubrobacteraceae bacterium]|nr:hypothetical protein [Solirubrobacteraceae bacterium]
MSVAHANTIADRTPQRGVACACPTHSDMPAARAGEAFNATADALAERRLR